jgi:hypothetical protein
MIYGAQEGGLPPCASPCLAEGVKNTLRFSCASSLCGTKRLAGNRAGVAEAGLRADMRILLAINVPAVPECAELQQ